MSTRQYSSFLLRFWRVSVSPGEGALPSVVLQLQNLQTGETWRLTSLEELNELLGQTLEETDAGVLPGNVQFNQSLLSKLKSVTE